MWPSKEHDRVRILTALKNHNANVQPLPGLNDPRAADVLALQFVASLRREAYYRIVQSKPVSINRTDPNHQSFDAERAVGYFVNHGMIDEASWLIFLMTHLAKPADSGWLRLQDIYGKLGAGTWDWATVSQNPAAFVSWLTQNWQQIRGKFGSHRKYESLRPNANRNMQRLLSDYVGWIGTAGHQLFFSKAVQRIGNDPHKIFDTLFREMKLCSFGRLAKFDYLMLISRYGIAPIQPGSAYLPGATGPQAGTRLLFDGDRTGPTSIKDLQSMLDRLDVDLNVGMEVMEDALCNWQKNPLHFVHFKG